MRSRPNLPRLRRILIGALGVFAAAASLTTAGVAHAGNGSSAVGAAGVVPAGAVRIGVTASHTMIHIDVVLVPRNPVGLMRYAIDVSTPGSPLYHHYLSPGQFPRLFGPAEAAIDNVLAWLRETGLNPGAVASDHLSIPLTATARQLESAFGITFARYRLNGRTGYSNTSAPRLPANIAAHVEAIVGLDDLITQEPMLVAPSKASLARSVSSAERWPQARRPANELTGGPQACSAAVNETHGTGAFTANQLAYAYEFSALYRAHDLGHGITIGIVEFSEPNLRSDISAYQKCYHTHTTISYVKVDGFNLKGPGEGEAALDIETILGLTPAASIVVYQAPNNFTGVYDIYRTIIDQDRVRIISESYGLCEHYQDRAAAYAANILYEQAAVQGQTIVDSTGDSGSEGCFFNDDDASRVSADFPASDPFVLGVGATTIFDLVARPGEAVWNERSAQEGAGGGGRSVLFPEPYYQRNFKIRSNGRAVPDVSADADPLAGYVFFYRGAWSVVGGTSASAPLWAALLALTDAKCPSSPVGWVAPNLYFTASPRVKAIVLNDISRVSGSLNNNDYTGKGHGHYPVGPGYDLGTGLGSPVGGVLATALCRYGAGEQGYWLATADGHVYAFHAPDRGSLAGRHPGSRVVGIATDRATNGYWLVTSRGKIVAFHAPFHGSAHVSSPVVGIASDASGSGYWIVTANGQVYAFNAPNLGSPQHVASKVVGIAGDPQTNGYWIVTAKGRVYAFDAGKYRAVRLSDVVAIASDTLQQGYWLITGKGQVYPFHVPSYGSLPSDNGVGRVVGMAVDTFSGGYWIATATGHVAELFAIWHGDHPGSPSAVVGIASTH
jgi:subtilase family serine protease